MSQAGEFEKIILNSIKFQTLGSANFCKFRIFSHFWQAKFAVRRPLIRPMKKLVSPPFPQGDGKEGENNIAQGDNPNLDSEKNNVVSIMINILRIWPIKQIKMPSLAHIHLSKTHKKMKVQYLQIKEIIRNISCCKIENHLCIMYNLSSKITKL